MSIFYTLILRQIYIIILHTPGIADKSGLLISSVNDKVISIESYFNEKIVPGKTIISYLPVNPFEVSKQVSYKYIVLLYYNCL
jgi:hypothetical protein